MFGIQNLFRTYTTSKRCFCSHVCFFGWQNWSPFLHVLMCCNDLHPSYPFIHSCRVEMQCYASCQALLEHMYTESIQRDHVRILRGIILSLIDSFHDVPCLFSRSFFVCKETVFTHFNAQLKQLIWLINSERSHGCQWWHDSHCKCCMQNPTRVHFVVFTSGYDEIL